MITKQQNELTRLKQELVRVKAERDAYRGLVLEAMKGTRVQPLPMRIDELRTGNWSPVADMRTPVGF